MLWLGLICINIILHLDFTEKIVNKIQNHFSEESQIAKLECNTIQKDLQNKEDQQSIKSFEGLLLASFSSNTHWVKPTFSKIESFSTPPLRKPPFDYYWLIKNPYPGLHSGLSPPI